MTRDIIDADNLLRRAVLDEQPELAARLATIPMGRLHSTILADDAWSNDLRTNDRLRAAAAAWPEFAAQLGVDGVERAGEPSSFDVVARRQVWVETPELCSAATRLEMEQNEAALQRTRAVHDDQFAKLLVAVHPGVSATITEVSAGRVRRAFASEAGLQIIVADPVLLNFAKFDEVLSWAIHDASRGNDPVTRAAGLLLFENRLRRAATTVVPGAAKDIAKVDRFAFADAVNSVDALWEALCNDGAGRQCLADQPTLRPRLEADPRYSTTLDTVRTAALAATVDDALAAARTRWRTDPSSVHPDIAAWASYRDRLDAANAATLDAQFAELLVERRPDCAGIIGGLTAGQVRATLSTEAAWLELIRSDDTLARFAQVDPVLAPVIYSS